MAQRDDLASFAAELRGATGFDAAAAACLGRVLDIADRALSASAWQGGAVLRALLHLRSGAGYEGLFLLRHGEDRLSDPEDGPGITPSATVWQWVTGTRRPLSVDVASASIESVRRGGLAVQWPARRFVGRSMSAESKARILDREATHLLVLPLEVAGRLIGMVSVEAACMLAVGQPFVWADCLDDMELTGTVAAPWLVALPRRSEALPGDELLPVVGPTMARVVRVLRAFALEDETLLLLGETGTGKSRIARWCHARSERRDGPFEVLDLLGVPEETQMGELFGWRRGAFTGAVSDHKGFVARARGGTLFIDEVDKLSPKAQAGLLRLLEERTYRVLGDSGPAQQANVRFVVGTNADLPALVEDGAFREDLYYRLDVLSMTLPPLRERTDELVAWAEYLLRRRAEERGQAADVRLSEDATLALTARDWPGNLRELDNVLRRASTMASLEAEEGPVVIESRHLRPEQPTRTGPLPVAGPVDALDAAAAAFVQALVASSEAPALEELDLGSALHGFVLAQAVRVTGGRDAAFELLGRGELVRNRNHHRALRRACSRARDLCRCLGVEPPDALRELLGRDAE